MFATYSEIHSELTFLADEFRSPAFMASHLTHELIWPTKCGCLRKRFEGDCENEHWRLGKGGFHHRFRWTGNGGCLEVFQRLVARGQRLLRAIKRVLEDGEDDVPANAYLCSGDWLHLVHEVAESQPSTRLWADADVLEACDTVRSRLSVDVFEASSEFIRVCLDDPELVQGDVWSGESPIFLPPMHDRQNSTREDSADGQLPKPPTSGWYTLEQAAFYLGISQKQLRNRCAKGLVKHRRDGAQGRGGVGQFRFRKQWLDEYAIAETSNTRTDARSVAYKQNPKLRVKSYVPESEWGRSLENGGDD